MMFDERPHLSALMERVPVGLGGRFYGVYPAKVCEKDPDKDGRVKITLPWLPESEYEAWARIATLTAGAERGSWFFPQDGEEVLVSFEAGDLRHPYVLGSLWSRKSQPPEGGKAALNVLKTAGGVTITMNNESGQQGLTLKTPGGWSLVLTDQGGGSAEITNGQGTSLKLSAEGVTIQTTGKFNVTGSQMEVSAAKVAMSAAMMQCAGVVQMTSAIAAASVSAAAIAPTLGNIA